MGSGSRFVEIPAASLLSELRSISEAIKGKGGRAEQGQQGREIVFDFTPPRAKATVRIYTTLAAGQSVVRDCGEDAVRLVVGATMPDGRFRSVTEPRKMLRTAPQNEEHHVRVRAFLDRLTEALREAYASALHVPQCPQCSGLMAERTTRDASRRRFYGCLDFPNCKGTRPMNPAA